MLRDKKRVLLWVLFGVAVGAVSIGAFLLNEASLTTGVFSQQEFILQAHRGYSGKYPQNTMLAFEMAAKEEDFLAIETDLQETKDGIIVLFHDETLDELTTGEGKISEYTFDQLKEITIDNAAYAKDYPVQRIPTLEDFLALCEDKEKIPYLELKELSEGGMVKLLSILEEGNWQNRCVITTQKKEYVPLFRSLNTTYPLEYMVARKEEYKIKQVIDFLKGYENMVFRPNAYKLRRREVLLCQLFDIRVESFGLKVGDEQMLERLKQIGVKGVTCNDVEGLFLKE